MFETVILALLQSLTEFLPVSSSGHLALTPQIFHWPPKGLAFDVALHVGTLGAVVFYFRKDVKNLCSGLHDCVHCRFQTPNAKLLCFLCIASFPALFVGFFLKEYAETVFRSPVVIATTLIFFGILLYVADRFGKKEGTLDTLTLKQVLIVGLFQVMALIPGTSRSGITMTASRFLGITREESARFSMLLSLPTIGAAGVWAFFSIFSKTAEVDVPMTQLLVGMFVAFVGGIGAVSFLMNWLKRFSFFVFAVYRILLGLLLLIFL